MTTLTRFLPTINRLSVPGLCPLIDVQCRMGQIMGEIRLKEVISPEIGSILMENINKNNSLLTDKQLCSICFIRILTFSSRYSKLTKSSQKADPSTMRALIPRLAGEVSPSRFFKITYNPVFDFDERMTQFFTLADRHLCFNNFWIIFLIFRKFLNFWISFLIFLKFTN